MIGYQDTCNCNFGRCPTNLELCYYSSFNGNNGTCDDNDFDTTCSGMIQGSYRYERTINYMRYLPYFYNSEYISHRLLQGNWGHSYDAMMFSPQGQCVLYNFGCLEPGVFDAQSSTPGIYMFDDFLIGL